MYSLRFLIPSSLDITFKPQTLLEVTFLQPKGTSITLHAGIRLPIKATAGPPYYRVVGDIGHGPFVIAAIDPDGPPPYFQVRHFLGANFFPVPPFGILVNETAALSDFLQPAPPPGSLAHRLFSASTGLGNPIAGTFMLVAPDPTT
ncbi:hypothetical protein H0H92_011247 [Tricholoma furcatifolium]|nr:hypothetical protein H0H92_011247 [Tricholoma furcatifolium]